MTDESQKERDDRELIELLNGLRVALPGVQILFAFLLTVPFAQGFAKATAFQQDAYVACLLCATVSIAFYIAPAAQHRLLFRAHQKDRLLRRSNTYAVIGNAALVPALAGAVLLVVDYVFSRGTAWLLAGTVVVLLSWLWLLEPALRREGDEGS